MSATRTLRPSHYALALSAAQEYAIERRRYGVSARTDQLADEVYHYVGYVSGDGRWHLPSPIRDAMRGEVRQ